MLGDAVVITFRLSSRGSIQVVRIAMSDPDTTYTTTPVVGKRKASDRSTQPATKGRPRKAPVDVEAVERRRTQLRVAQRAFRKRRETTLDELREQVASVQQRNDDMLAALRAFTDQAADKGLPNELTNDLLDILDKYSDLRDADDVASASASAEHNADTRSGLTQVEPQEPSETLQYTPPATFAPDYANCESTMFDAHSLTIPNDTKSCQPRYHVTSTGRFANPSQLTHTILRELGPSAAECFDGSSFANRLLRRILECGL